MGVRANQVRLVATRDRVARSIQTKRQASESDHPLQDAVIGVLVHNEEPNIEICLRAILNEAVNGISVGQVVVVSSGSTDRTEEIVRHVAAEDPRVSLISETRRTGKARALNILLRRTSQPLVVLLGGDVVFTAGSLIRLLEPFKDPTVGMTGVRPIPTNGRRGVVSNVVHVLWEMHHELSLTKPKLGEAVAFRRLLGGIDAATLVDEAMLEHLVVRQGLRLEYIPTAVVRNHGPETLREFMTQRTRIYRGHLDLAAATGYRVSSMDLSASGRAAWRLFRQRVPARYLLLAFCLETAARTRARYWRHRRSVFETGVWESIASSKVVVKDGHVLRAHYDSVQRVSIELPDKRGWSNHPNLNVTMSLVRRLIRAEDQLTVNSSGLTVTLRGDAAAAECLRVRLAAAISELEASLEQRTAVD